MQAEQKVDPVANNLWHVIGALEEVKANIIHKTQLLGKPVSFSKTDTGSPCVWHTSPTDVAGDAVDLTSINPHLPVQHKYGYIWTSLGNPTEDVFQIPEYVENDRRNVHAATIGVHVSAPRAIENFLDMGHFPFVHTNILGVEPHTEVKEYDVNISVDETEILATRCLFYQPMASAASDGGADVEYVYRVPHPYCSVLYKSSSLDESRMDVIALFVQPLDQERVRAHMMLSLLDVDNTDISIRAFQQTIFGQDKPILENQFPKRLPLDPHMETPIRADKSAIAYRRWLSKKGLTYGVIPVAA